MGLAGAGFFCAGGADTLPQPCTEQSVLVCSGYEVKTRCTSERDAQCTACVYPANSEAVENLMGCEWRCMSGFFEDVRGECSPCSLVELETCGAGMTVQECTARVDSMCVACAQLPLHGVYLAAGCSVSCVTGYWFNAETGTCCSESAYRTESGACDCLPGWAWDGETCVL
jgi:hypothetical protein